VLTGPCVTFVDDRFDYGEERLVTLGLLAGRVVIIAHAPRGDDHADYLDYSDIPPLGKEFFTKAAAAWPPAKQQLTIRLDADVLKWLKTHGRGYQTRINRILRAAMEGHPTQRTRLTPQKDTLTRGGLKPS
jgi:uncharacterized protein (DUF4415 family)